jgi:hypothetical protein
MHDSSGQLILLRSINYYLGEYAVYLFNKADCCVCLISGLAAVEA